MPAAPDHWQFCLKALNEKPGFSGPETLGTHGPDPFFFYGQVPWRKREDAGRAHEFAQWLHEAPPSEVLGPLVRAAQGLVDIDLAVAAPELAEIFKRPALRPLAFRFVKGMVMHYLLDRSIHPWVYWSIGFNNEINPDPPSRIRHAYFEAALATLGPVPHEGKIKYSQSPNIMLLSEKAWFTTADALFLSAFPDRYKKGMYEASFYDMESVLLFIWDPLAIKRKIFDAFGSHDSLPRSMIQPVIKKEFEKRDYRNAEHKQWLLPSTGAVQHESTGDLVQRALDEAKEAEKLICEIETEELDEQKRQNLRMKKYNPKVLEFISWLGNLNHEGCAPGEEMKYWNKDFYKEV
jgi:hypothetical protein